MGKEFDASLDVLFGKVDDLVSTKTVVGDAIVIGDITILPLIEVGVGVGLGGKDAGGSAGGMGAKITPAAVLAIQNGNIQLINMKNQDAVSKLIDMAPNIATKLNFGAVFGNKQKTEKEPEQTVKFEEELVVED